MKVFTIISGIASICSLLISLFVVSRVYQIYNCLGITNDKSTHLQKRSIQKIKGDKNNLAGRDIID